MSLSDFIADLWSEVTTSGALTRCPQESELLAYIENRLSERKRRLFEAHFLSCDNCRESLTLFAHARSDKATLEPVTDAEIKQQTASVIALIKQEEFNRSLRPQPVSHTAKRPVARQLQLAAAAVIVAAVLITAGVWMFLPPSNTTKAMQSIALAMKDERQLEPRLSGDIKWSQYSSLRGPEDSPKEEARLALEQAQAYLRSAEDPSAPTEARLTLAKAYLASGTQDGANSALNILHDLESRGQLTAEALNDTGVALFQTEKYDEAISYFSKALESRSDFNEALFNKALAEYHAKRHDESRRDWKEFISKSSDDKWKQEAQRYLDYLNSNQ